MNRREFVKSSGAAMALFVGRREAAAELFEQNGMRLSARVARYEGTAVQATAAGELSLAHDGTRRIELESATWACSWTIACVAGRADAMDLRVRFKLEKGAVANATVAVELGFANWSAGNYVSLPGAVYNGNRFQRAAHAVSADDRARAAPGRFAITINDIPRLNIDKGESRLEEFTGNLATPAVGIYSPGMQRGFWLLTDQKTRLGNYGITVEESADRSRATVMLVAPYLRRLRPTINGQVPSDDRGAAWQAGDELTLRLRLYSFDAPRLQGLFDRFLVIRKDLTGATEPLKMIPMSQVFAILEDKLNRENWMEDWGLYSLGARGPGESPYGYWQLAGWAGYRIRWRC